MLSTELLRFLTSVLLVLPTKTTLLSAVGRGTRLSSRRGIVALAAGTLVVVVDVFWGAVSFHGYSITILTMNVKCKNLYSMFFAFIQRLEVFKSKIEQFLTQSGLLLDDVTYTFINECCQFVNFTLNDFNFTSQFIILYDHYHKFGRRGLNTHIQLRARAKFFHSLKLSGTNHPTINSVVQ